MLKYQILSHLLINSPASRHLGAHILLGFLSEPSSDGVMDAGVGRSLLDPLHYSPISQTVKTVKYVQGHLWYRYGNNYQNIPGSSPTSST